MKDNTTLKPAIFDAYVVESYGRVLLSKSLPQKSGQTGLYRGNGIDFPLVQWNFLFPNIVPTEEIQKVTLTLTIQKKDAV